MKEIMCKIVDSVERFFLNIFEKVGLKFFTEYYKEHKEGMRYLVFGALTTVVNIIIFSVLFNGLNVSTTTSNIIAWIVSVIFAYITNKYFVFFSENKNIKETIYEIFSFVGARIFTLIVETIFLNIFIDKLGFNATIMKIFSNILVIILNFIFSKLFIFKKDSKTEK